MPQNQADEFLKDIKSDSIVLDDKALVELFDKPKAQEIKEAEPKSAEDDEEKPKTRRYKRLEKKNEEMEQLLVEMNDRIKELSEANKFEKENIEIDPEASKVFGTDENGKTIKNYFDKRFNEIKEEATREAYEKFASESSKASEAETQEKKFLDESFDNLEEKYGVVLNNPKTKAEKEFANGFVDFIENISPKDKDGDIVEYANFETSLETYTQLVAKTKPREVSDRQKELASRGMTQSGNAMVEAPQGPITFKTINRMIDGFRNQQ